MSEIVYKQAEPLRLDQFLSERLAPISRNRIAKAIALEQVKLNGQTAKASQRLATGDRISLPDELVTPPPAPAIDLPVIYQDSNIIVIDKPAGILTHAKGALDEEPSVATFIRPLISNELTGNRAGIVHRLDRGTSGVILCAKNPQALKYFQNQFAKRHAKKSYLALVQGEPKPINAIIDMPIERNPRLPSTFRTGHHGKPAETYYRLIKSYQGLSLLLLKPTTGRTHQLRVHLKAIGHPIIGDAVYGQATSDRLWLHAYQLSVILPDEGRVSFKAEPPIKLLEMVNLKEIIIDE